MPCIMCRAARFENKNVNIFFFSENKVFNIKKIKNVKKNNNGNNEA